MVLIALAACSAVPASTTGSPTATGASSTGTPARASAYRVLFTASTTSGNEILLYDSASNTPQQLVSLGAGAAPEAHFVTAQKIAYVDVTGASSRIMTFDLSTRASTADVTVSGYLPTFAYSHDGSMLAYLLHDLANKPSLHVRRGGQETSLNLNAIAGRGVGRDDELRLEYSPDDK
ncbi:MAG TPA: hypothetical protein VEQ67_24520, partial [Mycobacterium sp.]|nr:hypothetical protein [Mycobacterium sp.]